MRFRKCFMSQRTRHTSFWIVKQCSGKIVAHRLTRCDDFRGVERVGIETFETSYVARFLLFYFSLRSRRLLWKCNKEFFSFFSLQSHSYYNTSTFSECNLARIVMTAEENYVCLPFAMWWNFFIIKFFVDMPFSCIQNVQNTQTLSRWSSSRVLCALMLMMVTFELFPPVMFIFWWKSCQWTNFNFSCWKAKHKKYQI